MYPSGSAAIFNISGYPRLSEAAQIADADNLRTWKEYIICGCGLSANVNLADACNPQFPIDIRTRLNL